jgi:hypothetical protein
MSVARRYVFATSGNLAMPNVEKPKSKPASPPGPDPAEGSPEVIERELKRPA